MSPSSIDGGVGRRRGGHFRLMNAPQSLSHALQPGQRFVSAQLRTSAARTHRPYPRRRGGGCDALDAMARSLGPAAMLLDPSSPLSRGLGRMLARRSTHRRASRHWQSIVGGGRLEQVRGAFALAWRTQRGELCLCRDAIGERTLYWVELGDGIRLRFDTSRRCSPAAASNERIDPVSVAAYLCFGYLPGARSHGARRAGAAARASSCGGTAWQCHSAPHLVARARAGAPASRGRGRKPRACGCLEAAVRRRLPDARRAGRRDPFGRDRLQSRSRDRAQAARARRSTLMRSASARSIATSSPSPAWSPRTAEPFTTSSSCRKKRCVQHLDETVALLVRADRRSAHGARMPRRFARQRATSAWC